MRQLLAQNDNSITTVKEKAEFWSRRFSLDDSLKNLLGKAERSVLGPWKGLLLGAPVQDVRKEGLGKPAAKLKRELKRKHKVLLANGI